MMNRTWVTTCLTACLSAHPAFAQVAEPRAPSHKAAQKDIQRTLAEIADEAYLFAYPLLVMEVTKQRGTNVATPSPQGAPINQFAHVTTLPDDTFNSVVLPNVDTLYSSAFLDLTREPMVLHVPDTQDRFYLMPMLDAYTNVFASFGKRTRGTSELNVAVVGPNFRGEVPKELTKVKAPTNLVWLLGRTQINGASDLTRTVALTGQYTLTPLSSWGKPFEPKKNDRIDPKIDMVRAPPQIVAAMSDQTYFEKAAALLKANPPRERDHAAMAEFAKLGLTPGRFAPSAAAQKALRGAGARATKQMQRRTTELGTDKNGWRVDTQLGEYGTRYLDRATVALRGLGANLPEDAVYPASYADASGQPLSGRNRYVLHFEKGREPPVEAFWSLTMYGMDGYLVKNPFERFAIGNRDPLKRNSDGSLDLWVQHEKPEEAKAENWLPAPRGAFQLILRMYWPRLEVLDGSWMPPAIERTRK